MNPRTLMLFGSGMFLLALFAVATAGPRLPFARLRGEVPAAPASRPSDARAPAGEATMTASELWAAYGANPAASDAKWKGKPVNVTGTVVDVRRDYRGKFLVRLATGDSLEMVHASVMVQNVDLRAIPSRGQTVSLRCTGAGRSIGSPILDACRL